MKKVQAKVSTPKPAQEVYDYMVDTLDEAPVTASGTYDIRDTGSGTELVNEVVVETHGFMRLFEPIMGPQLRKTSARYEEALRQRLA